MYCGREAFCPSSSWTGITYPVQASPKYSTLLGLGGASQKIRNLRPCCVAMAAPTLFSFCTLLGSLLQRMSSRRPILRFCPSQPLMTHLCSCKIVGLRTVLTYCEDYLCIQLRVNHYAWRGVCASSSPLTSTGLGLKSAPGSKNSSAKLRQKW